MIVKNHDEYCNICYVEVRITVPYWSSSILLTYTHIQNTYILANTHTCMYIYAHMHKHAYTHTHTNL